MPAAPQHALAEPLELPCGVTLTNRIAKAALSEGLADRGNAPGERLMRLYRSWSRSGAGLLITGNVMVDRSVLGEPGNVVADEHSDLERLRQWSAAAKAGGAHVWMQINHPGRQVPRTLSSEPVAPSAIAVSGGGAFATPRALSSEEITVLIRRFATTAGAALEAGFTGIQVHGAHGYLISQFLSPLANQRTDEWGGSAQNRRRFLLETVRAVRARIGPEVPLSVKLNSADFQRGGMTEEESTQVVLELAREGIDLLEISGGTYESTAMMGAPAQPVKESTRTREAYFLDYAERIRTATLTAGPQQRRLPLMLTGGFRTSAGMADAIDSGKVDVAGLGRPLITQPELPAQLLSGTAAGSDVRPRRLGIKRLDGAVDLAWHATQMWRVADGKPPAPRRHPVVTLAHYLTETGVASLRRPRRGFAA